MGDAVEDYAGKPVNPVKFPPAAPGQRPQLTDEMKAQLTAYQKQVAEWRSSVSMDKFEEVKKMYNKAGVSIYAFKPNALNANNTDAEVEYALKAAKALGARSVTVELPTDAAQSKRLGDLGEKHKVYIGYHAHTKETLLALIEAKHDRITTMHIKDRKTKTNSGVNMPWGQGDTPIKEILTLLKEKKYKIPATIELEYDIPAGSDAVKETKICVGYAKAALEA